MGTSDSPLNRPPSPPESAQARAVERTEALMLSRFPIISDVELLARHSEPPAMLIDPVIERGALTMLSGSWGTGKTALLMSLGLAVSEGGLFAGRFLTAQGKVLLLALEASPYEYSKQLRKLRLGTAAEASVDVLPLRGVNVLMEGAMLRDRIHMGGYDLVLVDTLMGIHNEDENSNTAMAKVMDWLLSLNDLGMTVAFTHHTSKPVQGADRDGKYGSRGASVIPSMSDAEWRVSLKDDHDMTIRSEKSRGEIRKGTEHKLRMDWDKSAIAFSYDAGSAGLETILEDALIKAGERGLMKGELIEAAKPYCGDVNVDAVAQRVERAIKRLRSASKVKHAGQGKPYVWNG
jgi:RecA-family ATPase